MYGDSLIPASFLMFHPGGTSSQSHILLFLGFEKKTFHRVRFQSFLHRSI